MKPTIEELREFVWERCQMDNNDADEIMSAIKEYYLGLLPKKPNPIEYETKHHQGIEGSAHLRGWNDAIQEMREKMK
jgi:hypothetical protein